MQNLLRSLCSLRGTRFQRAELHMRALLLLLALLHTSDTMANYPEEISAYIEWDFEINLAEDYASLAAQSKKLRKEIDDEVPWYDPFKLYTKFARTNLNNDIGLKNVKIKYEYAEQTSSGDWIDHEEVLVISESKNITFGQILYELHHSTNEKLQGQDIMAIEGLELDESTKDESIPTYHVFFGS